MDWLKDRITGVFLISINIFFVLKLMEKSYKIQGFNDWICAGAILGGVIIYWLYSFLLRRWWMKFIFTFLLLAGAGVYFIFYFDWCINMFNYYFIINIQNICTETLNGIETTFRQFAPSLVTIIPILIILFLALYIKGFKNGILVFNAIILVILWYENYVPEVKAYLTIYLFLNLITYSINNYSSYRMELKRRGIRSSVQTYKVIIYMLVTILVLTEMLTILPKGYKGKYYSKIEGRFVNKYAPVQGIDQELQFGVYHRYNLVSSGYNNTDKKLGGPINLSTNSAFEVIARQPYYLKGIIKKQYTGYMWVSDTKKGTFKPYDAAKPPVTFDNMYFGADSEELTVIPGGLKTTTLFVPNYTYQVVGDRGVLYHDITPYFISSANMDKRYTVNFYKTKHDVEIFSKDIGKSYSMQYNSQDITTYKDYLQIPGNISERVYQLANKITAGAANNVEKVEKIKDYLTKNYPYSLSVREVPQGQEFLEYFLFNEKQGYCTYFATATAILCRMAGIPSRYVEGFKMPSKREKDGHYFVSNEDAHAWCEVLVDPAANLWTIVDPSPTATENREIMRTRQTGLNNQTATATPSVSSALKNKNTNNSDGDGTNGGNGGSLPNRQRTMLGLLLFFLSYLFLRMIIAAWRKRKLVEDRRVIPLYNYALSRISRVGIKKPAALGDKEFLSNVYDSKLRGILRNLVDGAYAEYYGNKEDIVDKANKKAYYQFIESYVKQEQKTVSYILWKYILW